MRSNGGSHSHRQFAPPIHLGDVPIEGDRLAAARVQVELAEETVRKAGDLPFELPKCRAHLIASLNLKLVCA